MIDIEKIFEGIQADRITMSRGAEIVGVKTATFRKWFQEWEPYPMVELKLQYDELREAASEFLLYMEAHDEIVYQAGGDIYIDLPPKARYNFIANYECAESTLRELVQN